MEVKLGFVEEWRRAKSIAQECLPSLVQLFDESERRQRHLYVCEHLRLRQPHVDTMEACQAWYGKRYDAWKRERIA